MAGLEPLEVEASKSFGCNFRSGATKGFYFSRGAADGHSADSINVAMLLQSVLLWPLATIAKTGTVSVRPMIAAFMVGLSRE
jgi:hypothetical protein